MKNAKYQNNLSKITPILLDENYKQPKVDKMISILKDANAFSGKPRLAVDIGCSIGFFTKALSPYFDYVVGIDIDDHALKLAQDKNNKHNVFFIKGDSQKMPFSYNSVDLFICNHVYEHVPSAEVLFDEMYDLISPKGQIYLGAASRLTIIEPHFHLPFLSWLPKFLAHRYMRLFGKGDEYYEKLRTYWGITALIKRYHVKDYTLKVLENPDKFCARDMIRKNSLIDKIPQRVWCMVYPLLPSFIFLLRKKDLS